MNFKDILLTRNGQTDRQTHVLAVHNQPGNKLLQSALVIAYRQ